MRIALTQRTELLEQISNFLAGAKVEIAGGFVGQEQGRLIHQGPRNSHALPLAAGKLAGEVCRPAFKADAAEKLCGPLSMLLGDTPSCHPRDQDIFNRRALRQQMMILEDEADAFASEMGELRRREGKRVDPSKRDRPGSRAVECSENIEQGAFPGSARSDDRQRVAARK